MNRPHGIRGAFEWITVIVDSNNVLQRAAALGQWLIKCLQQQCTAEPQSSRHANTQLSWNMVRRVSDTTACNVIASGEIQSPDTDLPESIEYELRALHKELQLTL